MIPSTPDPTGSTERRSCPDDGRCHHACVSGCFRVVAASPLSNVFPDDRWPADVVTEHGNYQTADDRDPYEAAFDAQLAAEEHPTPEPVSTAPAGSVVLCGSLDPRRVASLAAAAAWYRANVTSGTVVHVPVRDPSVPPEEHARRWYRLIDLADRVVVVTDPSGYIGEQTAREHAYAEQQGCTVVVESWQPAMRVSPAPDTEALRQQVAGALTTSRDPSDNTAVDESHLHANHQYSWACHLCTNNVEALTDAVLPIIVEREAGLRADLDRARAEIERLGRAVRAEASAKAESYITADTWKHRHDNVLRDLENARAELGSRLARSAGARTIPDDAAVLEVIDERDNAEEWADRLAYAIAPAEVIGEHSSGNNPWQRALDVLADLGATPNADPAPAAADGTHEPHQAEVDNAVAGALLDVYGFLPLDVRYKAARYARKVVADWQEAAHHTEPAAPQAPAEPTECNGSGVVEDWDAPADQWNVRGPMDTTGEPPGKPCDGCPSCTPAAREDTAPPAGRRPGLSGVRPGHTAEGQAVMQEGSGNLWDGDDDPADQAWRNDQADRAMSIVRPEFDALTADRDTVQSRLNDVCATVDRLTTERDHHQSEAARLRRELRREETDSSLVTDRLVELVMEVGGPVPEDRAEALAMLQHYLQCGLWLIAEARHQRDNLQADSGLLSLSGDSTQEPAAVDPDVLTVLEYVSRGRGYIGVTPYPDSVARRALGRLHDQGSPRSQASGTPSETGEVPRP